MQIKKKIYCYGKKLTVWASSSFSFLLSKRAASLAWDIFSCSDASSLSSLSLCLVSSLWKCSHCTNACRCTGTDQRSRWSRGQDQWVYLSHLAFNIMQNSNIHIQISGVGTYSCLLQVCLLCHLHRLFDLLIGGPLSLLGLSLTGP